VLRTLVRARDARTGYTTVHSAALFHRPKILRVLLDNGGAPDIAGYHDGQSALHKVARYPGDERQIECVKLLVRAGARIDQQDIRGNTALHLAVLSENVRLTECLVSMGSTRAMRNTNDQSALDLASSSLRPILDNHANNSSPMSDTLLNLMDNAISQTEKDSMLQIINRIPTVERIVPELLKRAITLDHYDAAERLLQNGMSPNLTDDQGNPILMTLTQIHIDNRIKYFDLLVRHAVDVNQVDNDGCHFFRHLVTELGEKQNDDYLNFSVHVLACRLGPSTVNMMSTDASGKALFSYLWRLSGYAGYSIRSKFESARQLLDWRESTSDEEKSLLTTRGIHTLAEKGSVETLHSVLLRYPGCVNSRNWTSHSSALHIACDLGRHEIVAELLSHRVELDMQDCFQSSALIRCFIPFASSVGKRFASDNVPAPRSYSANHFQCAKLLVNAGEICDVNLADDTSSTALHYAVMTLVQDQSKSNYFNALNMVKLLVISGANKRAKNASRNSPLDIANAAPCPDPNLVDILTHSSDILHS